MSKIQAKQAISKMLENVGKGKKVMPMSRALEAVGYSPNYSKNPQAFLKTKTAQELLEEYLPDELIAQGHRDLILASEIQHYCFPKLSPTRGKEKGKSKTVRNELTNDEIRTIVESVPGCRLIYVKRDNFGAWAFYQAPDSKSRKDGIDMAYKRKGDYAAEKVELTKRKYQDLSNAELAALETKLKNHLLKRKAK